jgi:hypothetical protein
MERIYPCKCKGECAPYIGLAACIMRTEQENDYCQWCKTNMRERTRHYNDEVA